MSHFSSYANEFGPINFSQLYNLLPGLPAGLQDRQELPIGWRILLGMDRELWAIYDSANHIAFTTSGPTYLGDDQVNIMENWNNNLLCGDSSMFMREPTRNSSMSGILLPTVMAPQPRPSSLVQEGFGSHYLQYTSQPTHTLEESELIRAESHAQFFAHTQYPFTFTTQSHQITQEVDRSMGHYSSWMNPLEFGHGSSILWHDYSHHWNHGLSPQPQYEGPKRFKSEHSSIVQPSRPPTVEAVPVLTRIVATTAKLQTALHAANSRTTLTPSDLSRRLPIELCLEIMYFSALIHGCHAVKTMSLICRDWRTMGQSLLFRCLSIGQITEQHQYTLRTSVSCRNLIMLAAIPRLATQVETIVIGGCRSQERTRFACLSDRKNFPNIRRFVLTKGPFSRMAYHRLPHVAVLDVRIPMTQPSKHMPQVQFRPSTLREVTLHTHEGMVEHMLGEIAKSPSAHLLNKVDLATALYSLGPAPSIGLHISKLSALTDLRINISLAQKFIGHLSDAKVLTHPTLTRLSLDLPTPRGIHTPEDILVALFGGADMPRLHHLTIIAQASSFKRSDSGWQIAFWHKINRSRRIHQSIISRELAARLTLLVVQLESQQPHSVGHMERSSVIVEDTRLLDLLQVGTREEVFRVEHTAGARVIYPDEAFVLGLTDTAPVFQTRKRKAN